MLSVSSVVKRKMKNLPNPNTLYANTFVDALVAAGLQRVCFTAGSRHTSLILAFTRHGEAIEVFSHLDERSAAFFALGLALAANKPVALVCTSGSAAANFFPAIVEAQQSAIPLLVLTADRPHELRHSGANQTIDQVKLYGDYVEWFYDAPLPEVDPPSVALSNLRTLAARALHKTANGVVHINLPFRKPFEPGIEDGDAMTIDGGKPTYFARGNGPDPSALNALLTEDVMQRKGLIYFGHGSCRAIDEASAMTRWAARLSQISGFPVLAEYTSNMRAGQTDDGERFSPLGAYESYINADILDIASIEVLIRIGAPPIAKGVQDLFAQANLRHYIYCSRRGEWADDTHRLTDIVVFDPAAAHAFVNDGQLPTRENAAFRERLHRAEDIAWQTITREIEGSEYFDGAAVFDVVDLLPENGIIFAGNSLPVRQLDQFGKPSDKPTLALANRGASGIDGNISTALGAGAAFRGRPLVAIVGDITFYHDMNALLAVQRCGVPITIVLLNNGGGGIFHRLPVRAFEPQFSDFFITAHGLDFVHAAKMYGLDYVRADDRGAFRQAFAESIRSRRSTIIEVRTDALQDLQRRKAIMAAVHTDLQHLKSAN